jgi:hypothetical protein
LATARQRPGRESSPLAASCGSALNRHLKRLLQDLFDNVDDALFERADKAQSNAEADLYFDAMRGVRKQRDNIEKTFLDSCLERYRDFWVNGPTSVLQSARKSRTISELSLVDEMEVEESLAVSNMAAKAKSLHRENLFAVEQRLGHILGGEAVDSDANPLGPTVIGNAFRGALKQLDTGLNVKLVVYKLFDRYVITALDGLYEEVNVLFVQAGIMPHLTRRSRAGTHPRRTARDAHDGRAGSAEADTVQQDLRETISSEIFDTLRRLVEVHRPPQAASADNASIASYGVNDVIGALSTLQHTNPSFAGAVPISGARRSDLKSVLIHTIPQVSANDEPRSLGQLEESAIDIVEMIFEFILDDPNLQDGMKALLSRLQIPILKVSIIEKSFFSNNRHPARRLLNELAHAAVGWTEQEGRGEGTMYARVEAVVNRVLNDFQNDIGVFAELLESFSNDIVLQRKSSHLVEDRATQAAQGKERLALAKKEVSEAIQSRLRGHRVPDVVSSLLQDGWKGVMVLVHLRQGPDSAAWNNALQVIDTLIWTVEPKSSADDRKQLIRRIPLLLRQLREGLTGISYDPHQAAKFFKELQDVHLDCLRGNLRIPEPPPHPERAAPVQKASGRQPAAQVRVVRNNDDHDTPPGSPSSNEQRKERSAAPSIEEQPAPIADQHDKRARSLRIGAWLEFTDNDGRRNRAKLAWKSEITTTCLFVNTRGLKVAEKSVEEIARELRSGQALLIDEIPLIDRTLETMMEALKGNTTIGAVDKAE